MSSTVAILGAGAGGAAATAELMQKGHRVRLWNRSSAALQPFLDSGYVGYEGVLGSGHVVPELMSQKIEDVVEGVDGILVCMPTIAHGKIAEMLAQAGVSSTPVVLNPGHTGGALEFYNAYVRLGVKPPPLAEFSTLTYVARKYTPDTVTVTGAAKQIRVAGMAGDDTAVKLAQSWFESASPVPDVIATSLSNANLVLHPPCSVLGAAWVEATNGDFTFYVEGMTDGVSQVMEQLDNERRAVAKAYGHELPSLVDEMTAIGTVEEGNEQLSFADKIRGGKANQTIKAPDTLQHRYYIEDFWYGLMPFVALARAVDVPVPVASSLMNIAIAMRSPDQLPEGRSAVHMGIQGLDKTQIMKLIRGTE